MSPPPAGNHWQHHARQWQHIAPPLRPDTHDLRCYETAVSEWHRTQTPRPRRALLLGVTPEIATMSWPQSLSVTAIDQSFAMIRHLWPAPAGSRVICASWNRLPLAAQSHDVVIGDGSFNVFSYPDQYRNALRALHQVLVRDGLFILRIYARPAAPESVDAVFADLDRGRIGNFHIFKFRVAMALHGAVHAGVCVGDVWHAWQARRIDPDALAERLRWPIESVRTIDAYRGQAARYSFPTLTEFHAVAEDLFVPLTVHVPHYEFGERCPIVIMQPR